MQARDLVQHEMFLRLDDLEAKIAMVMALIIRNNEVILLHEALE